MRIYKPNSVNEQDIFYEAVYSARKKTWLTTLLIPFRTVMEAHLEIRIPVVVFKDEDDDIWYAYSPVLEITGYGENEDEAKASFEIVLQETIEYMVTHDTLEAELRRLGWKKAKGRQTPPAMETLLKKDEGLRRMMATQHSLSYRPVPVIQ